MKHRKVKKYTVNTINKNEEGKKYTLFTNLKKARLFANEQSRNNNFISLLNFKRIPLAI